MEQKVEFDRESISDRASVADVIMPFYQQLRAIAQTRLAGGGREIATLQATAVVHEALLRIADRPLEAIRDEQHSWRRPRRPYGMWSLTMPGASSRSSVTSVAMSSAILMETPSNARSALTVRPRASWSSTSMRRWASSQTSIRSCARSSSCTHLAAWSTRRSLPLSAAPSGLFAGAGSLLRHGFANIFSTGQK